MYDYFFSGNQYIRVWRGDTGPGSVNAGYPAPISNWNWPNGFGANGIDAALYSGAFCYFFKGAQYVKVSRGITGPGATVAGPLPISDWKWPSGFGASGIDAALWSGPVCYFFSGSHYIRVHRGDGDFGTTDAGYPSTIQGGWGWPTGPFTNKTKGALPSGSVCYFFSGAQYIRVSRGVELAGYLNAGYPGSISNWGWPKGFGANGIDAALYSGGPLEITPAPGLVSNYNYFLASGGNALTGVSATVRFDNNFVSTANGFGFQLNCYSQEPSGSVKPTWQQYIIYAEPNKTQLWGWIDNWNGSVPAGTYAQLINWEKGLATLPAANTIKAKSSISLALLYDARNNVTGCKYTYTDANGNASTATINITDANLYGTSTKATSADTSPILAFTFNIVGDYNLNNAILSSGQGSITYSCNQALTVLNGEPSYTTFGDGTGETANIVYAGLPSTAPLGVSQIWGTSPTGARAGPASGHRGSVPPHVEQAGPAVRKAALPPHLDPHSQKEEL